MATRRRKLIDADKIVGEEYKPDEEIREQFAEAAQLGSEGERQIAEKRREYHSASPTLSGGDVDAAWEDAAVGEESVGGEVSTPGQNMVNELGEAVGLTYGEHEPLDTDEKLAARDQFRWELDPASAEDFAERMKLESEDSKRRTLGGLPAPQPLAGKRHVAPTRAGGRHRRHNK